MVLPLAPTSLGGKWPSPSHPAAPHHKPVLSSSSAQEAQKPSRDGHLFPFLPGSLNSTTSKGPSDHAGLIPETVAPPPLSWGGVFPVGPEAPTLLFSSDDPGAAFLPSFGSWDQLLFPKAFLLLTHCSPQLALYTTSELTTYPPSLLSAGFTRVDQESHGLS